MRTFKLLAWLTIYYAALGLGLFVATLLYPPLIDFLPIGGVEALINQPAGRTGVQIGASQVGNLGDSLMWLAIAIAGALVAAIPVSWTYIKVRHRDEYDQALVQTVVLLPMIVTSIVIVVHNSLALAFALAGIAAGVQFRNALKSPGDVLFILLSIGIGLAAGIGAVELAIVMSIAFNYSFLVLWMTDYGHRRGGERFMRRSNLWDDQDEEEEAEEERRKARKENEA
ncbi:DUF4956 domain-containing protein [Sphingosinicella sp.]|uniref:DUF4956 domain-containing protein n=1 Tax=Sphingosinicella sp. TaxID=1917971 RepID=UPI0040376EBB